MAGEVVAASIEKGDVSRSALSAFDKQWRKKFGANLRMAYRINQRIAKWDDAKWDQRLEVVKLLSPEQFSEALQSNLTGRWLWKFLATHPRALAYASSI